MKRIRIDKPRVRRERSRPEDAPIDPRDPDVVRAKALIRTRRLRAEAQELRQQDKTATTAVHD